MPAAYKRPRPTAERVAENLPAESVAGKRRLNLSVRADLIDRAREQGLNLSSVLEESLAERLRKAEGERWQAENAEAIAYHNARVARDGPLNADLIRF